uniref:cell cycle checkpoint protein RAD17-like n=1 Tax=Styela clava TaxID=7725 RepID=UPI00193A902D|nr:cell cycle checkpoint protein RAD17-like [Styela clava]XP_039257111.1 cell cycle checkpoint protein RAD17-like [Styela clava]
MSSSWPSTFDDFGSSSHSASKKRKRPVNNVAIKSSNEDSATWIDKYTPSTFDDLAVHKKKIAEVEAWISHSKIMEKKGAPILLLTGPSGCGKTATVLVAAAAHSVQIQEWTNPLSISFTASREAGLYHMNMTSQFEDFLFRSGRYPSLVLSNDYANNNTPSQQNYEDRKMLLLEDLPHHIIREPTTFRDLLRQYRRHQKHPLIIILSDGSIPDSVKRNLLPTDVLNQLKIQSISFNPVSMTSMNKALTKISTKENQKLSKEVLNSIVSSSSGDIRAAINSLQFILRKGTPVSFLQPESKKMKGSLKRRKSVDLVTNNAMPSIGGKDVSLVLFRALGKILYCKRKEPEKEASKLPNHLQHLYRDPLLFEPEDILDHCCLSGSSYSLFLHHNFVPFFSKLDDLSAALDSFCIADITSTRKTGTDFSTDSNTALDNYEGSLSSRSVAFWNSDRATLKQCESSTGQWRPLHKPSWYQVNKKCHENESSSHRLFWNFNLPNRELLLNMLPYMQKITTLQRNKNYSTTKNFESISLDRSQIEYLSKVISLPKWKSFSSVNEKIIENELGENMSENLQQLEVSCPDAADGENIEDVNKDPDEDFNIEEFSD